MADGTGTSYKNFEGERKKKILLTSIPYWSFGNLLYLILTVLAFTPIWSTNSAKTVMITSLIWRMIAALTLILTKIQFLFSGVSIVVPLLRVLWTVSLVLAKGN